MPARPTYFTIQSDTYRFPKLFSLALQQVYDKTFIIMQAFTQEINTYHIPTTYVMLQKHLPSVLKSTCFNDEQLPFFEEVKATEIGHLFEHILLEYLCEGKIALGYEYAVFNGVTNLNWKIDPYGMFHITINAGYREDGEIFADAFEKTITLMKLILRSHVVSRMDSHPFLFDLA